MTHDVRQADLLDDAELIARKVPYVPPASGRVLVEEPVPSFHVGEGMADDVGVSVADHLSFAAKAPPTAAAKAYSGQATEPSLPFEPIVEP